MDAETLRDALAEDVSPEDLPGATVRALLAVRAGRDHGLTGHPAEVAAAVEERDLGAAYERLLGARRTSRGTFYTPAWLVEHLLDVTLGPVLADRGTDEVLALRVCDPTCGSGRFLVAAARRIGDRLAELGHAAPYAAAVRECVLGVDVDPVAADLARAALEDLGGEPGRVLVADALGPLPEGLLGGCDVVVGNPPFRGRLRREGAGVVPAEVDGVVLGPYTDLAAAFLVRGTSLLAPGGRLALVQPRSVLVARDAAPVRRAVGERATLVALWATSRAVFPGTPVLTCAPVLHRVAADPSGAGPVEVVEDERREVVPASAERLARGWGFLLAEHPEAVPGLAERPRLGEEAVCTADFRDQYYGLVGHVAEGEPAPGTPGLLTSGTIDPAHATWGERPTRFARQDWARPVVRTEALAPAMTRWAAARSGSKLLVATQGRVLEAVADEDGRWLPGVPVLSVLAPRERLWHLLAALLCPVLSAHAAGEYAGSALAAGAIKLSAAQLAGLPLPAPGARWDAAADAVRRAQAAADPDERAELLLDAALASTAAYDADLALVPWWAARAERSVPGVGAALSRRG